MTDYLEEQQNEIEALQSIYPDEIEIIAEKPFYNFKTKIICQDAENFPDHATWAELEFTYTATYPDAPPLMEVTDSENLDVAQLEALVELMNSSCEESLGMAMVFTVMTAVQEHLTELTETMKREEEEENERRIRQAEEEEQKRFEGTIVTVETFMSWKLKFDAEKAEMRRLKGYDDSVSKKPTGKALFLSDNTMNDSDVKFLQDEGDTLEVDESLFENLGDLDLDDEDDDDDPDYVP